MALNFVAASSQYLEKGAAVRSSVPLTMVCWHKPTSLPGVAAEIFSQSRSGGGDSWFTLELQSGGAMKAQEWDGATAGAATSGGTLSAGTWAHIGAVFTTNGDRTVYLNGTGTNNTTNTPAPSGIDKTNLGTIYAGGTRSFFANGDTAEAAIYNVALTAADMGALAAAFSPLLVRPEGLVAYWPLLGQFSPEIDLIGRNELTVTGATAAAHCRIFTPTGPTIHRFGSTAVSTQLGRMFQVF